MSYELLIKDAEVIAEALQGTDDQLDVTSCLEGQTPTLLPFNHFRYGSSLFNAHTLITQARSGDEYYEPVPELKEPPQAKTKLGKFVANALTTPNVDHEIPRLAIGKAFTMSVCINTETNFLSSLGFVSTEGLMLPVKKEIRQEKIVVDEEGKPVLFQEALEAKTSLTLTPLSIGGVEYPAGTVVKTVISPDAKILSAKPAIVDGIQQHVVKLNSVRFIQPGRLTEFAFEPYERPLVFTSKPAYDNGNLQQTYDVTLDQIRDKVASLL